ncbi:hypothetical protein Tco_1002027 [Tanacetum coccineum]|uniref:Uncharacterized protein n=1 Tax=Tanacetum coccineum TaxID=301880 RepID=A0ABQ5F608_9ASTR
MDIFRDARVFLEGTPVMGTKDFHYCPGVLGGDTCDGYKRVFINARVFLEGTPTMVVPAGSSSSVPADYVSAGHVLVPADRDRIC